MRATWTGTRRRATSRRISTSTSGEEIPTISITGLGRRYLRAPMSLTARTAADRGVQRGGGRQAEAPEGGPQAGVARRAEPRRERRRAAEGGERGVGLRHEEDAEDLVEVGDARREAPHRRALGGVGGGEE